MTQDKELLLKDLCARLPYGVKYMDLWNPDEQPTILCDINVDVELIMNTDGFSLEIEKCRPYLFPLSSITEEQKNLFSLIVCKLDDSDMWRNGDMIFIDNETDLDSLLDFYNKNHLDWRGLIPKGLAIDATGLNIY